MTQFFQQRLLNDDVDFFGVLEKLKLKTFTTVLHPPKAKSKKHSFSGTSIRQIIVFTTDSCNPDKIIKA